MRVIRGYQLRFLARSEGDIDSEQGRRRHITFTLIAENNPMAICASFHPWMMNPLHPPDLPILSVRQNAVHDSTEISWNFEQRDHKTTALALDLVNADHDERRDDVVPDHMGGTRNAIPRPQ
jgi:hypothetical protein